jgi:ABC-2 type transport system ATP-binding protein
MIRDLRGSGKTVVLTTHYLEEAEQLSDRVAIIVGGEIRAEGTLQELRERHAGTVISFRQPAEGWHAPDGLVEAAEVIDGVVTIETLTPTRVLQAITSEAVQRGIELAGLSVRPRSLEDIYLRLSGEGDRE